MDWCAAPHSKTSGHTEHELLERLIQAACQPASPTNGVAGVLCRGNAGAQHIQMAGVVGCHESYHCCTVD